MKMRELEKKTGVNRETIRVYFRQGLLPEPHRPKPNVADYDESHIKAIGAVRKLQVQSGMTLPQIRDALNGKSPRQRLEAGAYQHLESLLSARVKYDGERQIALSRLMKNNPHAASDARALAAIGIVSLNQTKKGAQLSALDARLVDLWNRMRQAGFDETAGFSADILSYYLEAAQHVADQEARLFFERAEGHVEEEKAAEMLEFALPTMLEFFGLLRLRIFLKNVRSASDGRYEQRGMARSRRKRPDTPRKGTRSHRKDE